MPEKALAAAALVWSASDMTETRAPASKNTTSSPDVGSLSITESTQTSSGGTPRSISVPGERSGRSTTPKPTSSESVRESSPKSVADARISDADGFHLATGSSSVPQSYYSDTTSVHDDVGASSSQDVQRQSSSGEPSTTHLQDVRVDKREGWLVGEDEYDDRDDLVFDSAKEASARSSPLSTLPQAKTTVIFDTRSIQPSPTQTVAHNEKEAHSWEGSVPAIVDRYTDTSPVNSEVHYLQLPTGDHGGIDRSSTASKNFPIPESELSAFETGETQTEAHIMETQGEHGTSNRIESGFALDLEDWMGLNGDSESAGGSLEGVGHLSPSLRSQRGRGGQTC
ncbi:hypothetical protein OG21DRAFT_1284176 [Imleria badia]|nr:hypothetical protein OG21DRAFT_1284176 [Imleria badia]